VWEPILSAVAATGHEVLALDFPGFGLSDGRLVRDEAAVPALAACALRFLDALGIAGPLVVGGHDIGGAVAQHLAAHARAARGALSSHRRHHKHRYRPPARGDGAADASLAGSAPVASR